MSSVSIQLFISFCRMANKQQANQNFSVNLFYNAHAASAYLTPQNNQLQRNQFILDLLRYIVTQKYFQ